MKQRFFLLVLVLATVFSTYELGSALYIRSHTGLLQLSANNQALLTITQPGHGSVNVGTGTAQVRLPAGTYQVIASLNKNQTIRSVKVIDRERTNLMLTVTNTNQVPAPSSANAQASKLIKLLPFVGPGFEYKVDYFYTFPNGTAQPAIVITAPTASAQKDALNWIKAQDINTSELTLQYKTEAVK